MSRALWTLRILSSALDWHSKSNSSQDSKAGHPAPASFLPLSLLGPGLVTSAFVGLWGEITPQQRSQLDDRQGCSLLVRNGFPWHLEPNLKLFPCFHKTLENPASDLSPTPLLILLPSCAPATLTFYLLLYFLSVSLNLPNPLSRTFSI